MTQSRRRTLTPPQVFGPRLVERLEPRCLLAADVQAGGLLDGYAAVEQWLEFTPLDSTATEATSADDASAQEAALDDAAGAPADGFAATPAETADDTPLDPILLDELFGTQAPPEGGQSVTAPETRHNPVRAEDVDADGILSPRDALLVVNHLHFGDPSVAAADDLSAPGVFYTDVTGDGQLATDDVDAVFAALNASAGAVPAASARLLAAAPLAAASLAAAALAAPSEALLTAEGEAPPQPIEPPPAACSPLDAAQPFITACEVETLLARAAGATSTQDAIIAIVDRGGTILGVRVEQSVLDNIPDLLTRVFAIDGAVAKARTAAFFANNQAPLTSRTIRSLSQSTITEREVESNPTVPNPLDPAQNPFNGANPISRTFGPGFVAPVGVGGHFPPNVAHTPPVDLFGIERQSRDSLIHPGLDGIKGTADDIPLPNRFNVPDAFLPQGDIPAPESYGVQSGLVPHAVPRGIATMPGGIPLYKAIPDPVLNTPFTLVGGIGVFFPGTNGYATFEQGFVPNVRQSSTQRLNSTKALEAEYIAIAAVGGVTNLRPVGAIGGVAPPAGYVLPFGRIDLVGIQLEVFGPNPTAANKKPGIDTVMQRGQALGQGSIFTGANQIVTPMADKFLDGTPLAEGWLVAPHDSPLPGPNQLKQADVEQIVARSIAEADRTRAAIRLDVSRNPPQPGPRAKMVIAVADTAGNVLGLYRMHDATFFSLDVAVAKARNTAYYADPSALQNNDLVDDDLLVAKGAVTVAQLNKLKYRNNGGWLTVPDLFRSAKSGVNYSPLRGLAFTNRTFRFLAEPRYPAGVDGSLPPVFSILTDLGIIRSTAENWSQSMPTPAPLMTSVMGFDAFHVGRNFSDPSNIANQNGVVFFPGSTPLYKSGALAGGFGISGDGVDQDDVVTFAGQQGFAPPQHLRADMTFYRGVRLPFQKFNRNPQG